MQLKQLKLAGFKSFVDPTTIAFPSQLVGVVGPNGCGKSNVIDAVRWVMGESSAKNLRGESMIDVIFNGSSQRKSVGQASVELVFDNSLGRLTGQYGSYQEISVKRVVTRDGDSSYYLNGTRCRRRDITDIFLGTGAGTRGYSIIGQGTISRIVEARPEELRAFLEEAAGISKYKERRRETLQRISQTRENLARVADIREELDKQLQRLERQAKAAERYQQLTISERRCKAEILALKWMSVNEEQALAAQQLNQLIRSAEQQQTIITHGFNQTIHLREAIHDASAAYQHVQNNYYQLSTDVARLEEMIAQQQREQERLRNEQQQLQQEWQMLSAQIQADQDLLETSEENLSSLSECRISLTQERQKIEQELTQLQILKHDWQIQWTSLQSSLTSAMREKDIEEVRIQQLTRRRQEKQILLQKIVDEQQQSVDEDLEQRLNIQAALLPQLHESMQELEQTRQRLLSSQTASREQTAALEAQLQQHQQKLQQLSVEQATLRAQVKAAAPLPTHSPFYENNPQLLELIQVEQAWQHACELVLGSSLHSVVVDSMDHLWEQLAQDPHIVGEYVCVRKPESEHRLPRLTAKITGPLPALPWRLETIITANSLEEALDWLPQINSDESIFTKDGFWLSKTWLRVAALTDLENTSLLAKQQRLTDLKEELTNSHTLGQALQQQRTDQQSLQQNIDNELEELRQTINEYRQQIKENELILANLQRQQEQQLNNVSRLQEAYEECCEQLEALIEEQQIAEEKHALAIAKQMQNDDELHRLENEKKQWDAPLQNSQQKLEKNRTDQHQNELQHEKEQLTCNQLNNSLGRDRLRLQVLQDQLENIAEKLVSPDEQETPKQHDLLIKVEQQAELAQMLEQSREMLTTQQQQLEQDEASMRQAEKVLKNTQEQIQQQQLNAQALNLRAENLLTNLQELNFILHDLLAEMPMDLTLAQGELHLQEIVEKIRRLGAINLAAIEEYEHEALRKKHLDEQYDDLTEALSILDTAIDKMDKETRQRLQLTFDEVNRAFQSLFPRLFGGGRAMLELTCDNLLEAGVLVMAQPPGKRNSTIHLLSGGEKAMTAVALVFAIFQLNPSPFCMLDEVDAPLDDLNVGRFCALVKEMSHAVQFLFITHNKVTMELAEHLIGVTMREPGVSRVVAVDVEQALALVDA